MKDMGEIERELSKNSNGSTSSDCRRKSRRSKMLSEPQVGVSPLLQVGHAVKAEVLNTK